MVAAGGMGGEEEEDREGAKEGGDQCRALSLNSKRQRELRRIKESCSWLHAERHRWDGAGETLQVLDAEEKGFKHLFSRAFFESEQWKFGVKKKIILFFLEWEGGV